MVSFQRSLCYEKQGEGNSIDAEGEIERSLVTANAIKPIFEKDMKSE